MSIARKGLTKRGGAGRGQGRKPLKEGVETKPLGIRVTPTQREKFYAVGGAEWFRRALERAKVPTKKG